MQGKKRRVRCVETRVVYPSIRAAARSQFGYPQDLWKALNGRVKTYCGYHWEYAD